jgi:hypothetical protein
MIRAFINRRRFAPAAWMAQCASLIARYAWRNLGEEPPGWRARPEWLGRVLICPRILWIRDAIVAPGWGWAPRQRFDGGLVPPITIFGFGYLESRYAVGDPDAVLMRRRIFDAVDTAHGHRTNLSVHHVHFRFAYFRTCSIFAKPGSDPAYLVNGERDYFEMRSDGLAKRRKPHWRSAIE